MIVPSTASKTMWHATIRLITEDVGLLAMSAPETLQGFPSCFFQSIASEVGCDEVSRRGKKHI